MRPFLVGIVVGWLTMLGFFTWIAAPDEPEYALRAWALVFFALAIITSLLA